MPVKNTIKWMLGIILLFVLGIILGSVVSVLCSYIFPKDIALEASMVLSYPVMFLPVLVWMLKTRGFEGMKFSFKQPWYIYFHCCLGTFVLGVLSDGISLLLPEMPENLKSVMESLTGGNFFLNFLSVSLLAPLCEEILCRGIILRGLKERGVGAVLAIAISASLFAIMHGNIWQGVPAFIIGCFLGYVYWKTGSLALTMAMHFFNNTLSLVLSQSGIVEDYESWFDMIPSEATVPVVLFCVAVLLICVRMIAAPSSKQSAS